jgi:hypothetical protein
VLLALSLFLPTAAPVMAQELGEQLAVEAPVFYLGSYELTLGGFAHGALFQAQQSGGPLEPDGLDETDATGQVRIAPRLQRIYDSGLIVGAESRILVVRDILSGDSYGNDALEKFYLYMQTGLGRLEIGQQDGVGYTLGMTGPVVDRRITLENPHVHFFRDPTTRNALQVFSNENTVVSSSSNLAKVSYLTPRLFGAQIGLSFTPNPLKSPLPITGNKSNLPNVQAAIWEIAGSYTTRLSNVAVGISAAFARGALRNPTPGHSDIHDAAFGLQFAFDWDMVRLSWGGAYRISNGYGFAPGAAFRDESTERVHLSAMAERGPWRFGGEYSFGAADAPSGAPDFDVDGYQLAAGYRLNDNLQLSAGWQWRDYERSLGAFHNGAPAIDLNAGFVGVGFDL